MGTSKNATKSKMKLLPVFVGLTCSAMMTYYMPNCEIQVADLLKYDEPERLEFLERICPYSFACEHNGQRILPGTSIDNEQCERTECYCDSTVQQESLDSTVATMKSCTLSFMSIGMNCQYPLPVGCHAQQIDCGWEVKFYHDNPKLSPTCRPLGPPACMVG